MAATGVRTLVPVASILPALLLTLTVLAMMPLPSPVMVPSLIAVTVPLLLIPFTVPLIVPPVWLVTEIAVLVLLETPLPVGPVVVMLPALTTVADNPEKRTPKNFPSMVPPTWLVTVPPLVRKTPVEIGAVMVPAFVTVPGAPSISTPPLIVAFTWLVTVPPLSRRTPALLTRLPVWEIVPLLMRLLPAPPRKTPRRLPWIVPWFVTAHIVLVSPKTASTPAVAVVSMFVPAPKMIWLSKGLRLKVVV